MPLNRDGSLNLQFHREVLLGENTIVNGKDSLTEREKELGNRELTKKLIAEMFTRYAMVGT